jgi:hypothetical protein
LPRVSHKDSIRALLPVGYRMLANNPEVGPSISLNQSFLAIVIAATCDRRSFQHDDHGGRFVRDFRKAHALKANARQVRTDISFDQLLQAFRRQ